MVKSILQIITFSKDIRSMKIRMLTFLLISILFSIFLTSCATYKARSYEPIDQNNKSIIIDANDLAFNGYLGEIKDAFRSTGWKVYAIQNTESDINGTINKNVKLRVITTQQVHYKLAYSWTPNITYPAVEDHVCNYGMNYSISIIDLKTGQEAFSMSGISCGEGIIEKLKQWLAVNSKA